MRQTPPSLLSHIVDVVPFVIAIFLLVMALAGFLFERGGV
jgi:hypothetical protein